MNTEKPSLPMTVLGAGLTGGKGLGLNCMLPLENIPKRKRKNHEASWCQSVPMQLKGLVWTLTHTGNKAAQV